MKYNLGLLAFLAIISIALGDEGKCSAGSSGKIFDNEDWKNNMIMDKQNTGDKRYCTKEVQRQIQVEVGAAVFYLELGAYFSRDDVNRPGFAKFFLDAAKEEREHATHLIDYLTMRGETNLEAITKVTPNLYEEKNGAVYKITSGLSALEEALKKELGVTASIKKVIETCEKTVDNHVNDYHFVDYLTGVYLEEQYKGQRDLAGKIATLTKMKNDHGVLGEFMFDKTLL